MASNSVKDELGQAEKAVETIERGAQAFEQELIKDIVAVEKEVVKDVVAVEKEVVKDVVGVEKAVETEVKGIFGGGGKKK